MQSSLEEEAKEDEDTYEKMQCWCKSNGDEKAKSIEEAEARIKGLEARTEELAATSSRLTSEIATSEDEVVKNEAALDTAVTLRKQQLAEFHDDEKDLTQSASSVDRALDVINGSETSSFLQMPQARLLSALSQLRAVVSKHGKLLTKTQREKMDDFLKNPLQTRTAFLQKTSPDTTGGVAGVLSGLKGNFQTELADLQSQEKENEKAHEGLVKAKTEEIEAGKKQLEAKKEQKATADLEHAQAKQDIKDTTAALEADGSLNTVVKEKCAAMDADYEKRSKLRTEEQTAVAKAIQVLSSDEVGSDNERAAKLIAQVGKKLDVRLSTLALTMHFDAISLLWKLDTFEKVKKAIDEMKADLKKEQAAEVKKKAPRSFRSFCIAQQPSLPRRDDMTVECCGKDWCTEEFQRKKLETQEKTREEQTKLAEMESLQSSVSQLGGDIKLLEDEAWHKVSEMNKQIQVAGQNREKENKEFQKVVAEQRKSQMLLKDAMTTLKSVYAKEASFMQEQSKSKSKSGESQEPEFKDFKQQSSSYGVLSMLQQLVADSKAMEVEATHAESTAQQDYEACWGFQNQSVDAKTKDITDKEGEKGATEASLVEARQSKAGLSDELSQLAIAVAELHDQCDFLLKNFDARQSAREDEMDALQQAKSMLSGDDDLCGAGKTDADLSFATADSDPDVNGISFACTVTKIEVQALELVSSDSCADLAHLAETTSAIFTWGGAQIPQPESLPARIVPSVLDFVDDDVVQRPSALSWAMASAAKESMPSMPPPPPQKRRWGSSSLGVALVIGRVVGKGSSQEVVLPVATEVLLEEGLGHSFIEDLGEAQVSRLRAFLDNRLAAHKGKPPSERRWASVSLEQRNVASGSWRAVATVYCPGSRWHYQMRLRELQGKEGHAKDRKEFNLVFQKVAGGQDPAWTVSIVQEGERVWTELRMNEAFFLGHRARMLQGEQHSFSRLCRDFRRNAQALQQVLDRLDDSRTDPGGKKLFYPGIFDMSSQVQEFYSKRAQEQTDFQGADPTRRVKRFNNCIKTMLLEGFVDDLKGDVRILDLCSGRGQDIGKYSREHRACAVKSVVCVDFAIEAVEEARRRYRELHARSQQRGQLEFAASFYAGDCRDPTIFDKLVQDGHAEFDVVVCQFALHYLLASEQDATTLLQRVFALLRPGGRFIATVPRCEELADLYEQATPSTDSARSLERELQRSLFHVHFEGEAWQGLQATGEPMVVDEVFQNRWGLPYRFWLQGAVAAEEYLLPWEAFELLAVSLGFRLVADAAFPEIFQTFKQRSRFFKTFFSRERENASMNRHEEEVFNLYSAFVLERPCDPSAEKDGGAEHDASSFILVLLPKHMAQPPPLPPVAYLWAKTATLRSMLAEGRKEDTAKNYARNFVRLFEEDRKAPSEMASQEFFDFTKVNGSGVVKRAPKKKEPDAVQSNGRSEAEKADKAENTKIRKRQQRETQNDEDGGTAEDGRPRKRHREDPGPEEPCAEDATGTNQVQESEVSSQLAGQRKVVKLDKAFDLLAEASPGGPAARPNKRPRAVLVHGRDPSKRMTARVHGIYTELAETKDERPVFEKADHEKRTYIFYYGEKKTWRMSVSLASQGDFAKVKEPAELPWLVSRPWKVFNGEGSYEEDATLVCDFLDPEKPLPDAEVEVCLRMPPPGQLGTSSSSSAPRPTPATQSSAGIKPNGRVLQILGLDSSIKNAQRVMGVYAEQVAEHGGQPVFKKTDEAKPSFLYFDTQKERWRIAKSMEEKGDYAHVKDKGQLPWLLKKPWKVYDGDKYAEVAALQVQEADPSSMPSKAEAPAAGAKKGKKQKKRPDQEAKASAASKGSKNGRDRKWLGQQMQMDELPLEALKELPKDAPPGHDAWRVVKWEPSHNRALFQFRGARIQTTQFGCGSKHAAEVVARACYVMLADGKEKDEVMNFRDDWYRRMRAIKSGQAIAAANGHAASSDISPKKQKAGTPETAEASAELGEPSESRAQASSPPPASSPSSSSSESEDSPSVGKASESMSREDGPDAGQRGVGFLDPDNPPGAMGRVCAKMAARTGIRCFKCYLERHRCQCKESA
ncbi:unnamed protein product [Symbiodinium pilosum]|uniref:mRNA (guanine-N(7))-methyltransferase n=1 Tax=Symbiodinium pilosum TaxID=2952 RepID=A0A812MEJ4_SYMPI|nr:unnamed protein product [Symbiodinium pilosum]